MIGSVDASAVEGINLHFPNFLQISNWLDIWIAIKTNFLDIDRSMHSSNKHNDLSTTCRESRTRCKNLEPSNRDIGKGGYVASHPGRGKP